MKSIERASFASLQDFAKYGGTAPLVYFHIFSGAPDQGLIDALSQCGPEEALVLLDVNEDRGFLKETGLDKKRGLGAWTKGAYIDFTESAEGVSGVIRNGRRFAFPPQRTPEERKQMMEELGRPAVPRRRRRG